MANNLVLDTLRVHRQEIGEEQQLASALVAQCQEDIAQRRASLNTTEHVECAADAADISHQHQGLREAEARLVVAEQHCTLLQQSWRDLTEDIERVQQGA